MAHIVQPNSQRGRALRWWRHERSRSRNYRLAARSDAQAWRLLVIIGGLMLGALALWVKEAAIPGIPDWGLIAPRIDVIDGDTVRSGGQVYRLVGYNTPEAGLNAGCGRERALASDATRRLRQLVAGGEARLEPTRCACPRETEGTEACNYGRRCGRLTVDGKDVGRILNRRGSGGTVSLRSHVVSATQELVRRLRTCASGA